LFLLFVFFLGLLFDRGKVKVIHGTNDLDYTISIDVVVIVNGGTLQHEKRVH
jgi:hypothetical protein